MTAGPQQARGAPGGAPVLPAGRARYGPRLLAVLNTVSARLTTGSLRGLDARVQLRGENPRRVAGSWLRAQGLAWPGGASQ